MTISRGHGEEMDFMIEQAYRRGYDQGFDVARRNPKEKLEAAGKRIHKWRYSLRSPAKFEPPPGSGFGGPL